MELTNHKSRRVKCRPAISGRPAFTLIEVLVVITIVGILASLITVAALGALKHARRSEIKMEIDKIDTAFHLLKDKNGEYPPNCQADGFIAPDDTFKSLKRYMKSVAPRHREPDDLLANMLGIWVADQVHYPRAHNGGITPAEAIVLWLGGLSDDPNYPITGKGGPSYIIAKHDDPINRTLDPIESRKGIFKFDVDRLGPRAADGYFEEGNYNHIEYFLNGQWHRINFWTYSPRRSDEPYVYFDVSRSTPSQGDDVHAIAANLPNDTPAGIYIIKQVDKRDASGAPPSFKFVNQGKFQILHCGLDNSWGNPTNQIFWPSKQGAHFPGRDYMNFLRLDIDGDRQVTPEEIQATHVYPTGPFPGDLADTVTNFGTEVTIDDAPK